MKVMVIGGYVSHQKNLYEPGDIFELDDDAAKRLMKRGAVVEFVDPDTENATVETPANAGDEPAEDAANAGDEPAEDAALPDVDPTANVKPKRRTTRAKK
jgi:hypothetical protein